MELRETPVYIAEYEDGQTDAAAQVVSKVKKAVKPYWGEF